MPALGLAQGVQTGGCGDRSALAARHKRHLAAINLIRCAVDLPTIQAHLGHKHLLSTLRYAAYADVTASARAARALDQLFGEGGGPS